MGKQVTTGQIAGTPDYQFWESNPMQSTALETWQTAMSRTPDPMAAGTYKLTWYCEIRVNPVGPVNSDAAAQFVVGGSVKGSAYLTTGNDWHAFSGWDRYIATEGEQPVLALEYRRDPDTGGNDNIEIRKMKLGIERMDTP
jgi:hypothetical protein